jgi:hypothetical protein
MQQRIRTGWKVHLSGVLTLKVSEAQLLIVLLPTSQVAKGLQDLPRPALQSVGPHSRPALQARTPVCWNKGQKLREQIPLAVIFIAKHRLET